MPAGMLAPPTVAEALICTAAEPLDHASAPYRQHRPMDESSVTSPAAETDRFVTHGVERNKRGCNGSFA
jgi:hypothetical protein